MATHVATVVTQYDVVGGGQNKNKTKKTCHVNLLLSCTVYKAEMHIS